MNNNNSNNNNNNKLKIFLKNGFNSLENINS